MSDQTVFLGLWQGASAPVVRQLMVSKWPPARYQFRTLRTSPAIFGNECITEVASLYSLMPQTDQSLTDLESENDPNTLYAKVYEIAQNQGGLCVLDFSFMQNLNTRLNWPLVIALSCPSFENIPPEEYGSAMQTLQPVSQTSIPQWPLGLGPARSTVPIPVGVIHSRVVNSPEFQKYIAAVVDQHRKKLSAAVTAEGEEVKAGVQLLAEKFTSRTQEMRNDIKENCKRMEEAVTGLKLLKGAIEAKEFPLSAAIRLNQLRQKIAEGQTYISTLRSRLDALALNHTNPVPPACIMRVEADSFSLNVYVANFKQRFVQVNCYVEEGYRQVVKPLSEGLKPGICCIHIKNALVGFKSALTLTLFGEVGTERFPLTRPYNCSLSLSAAEPNLKALRDEVSEQVTMDWVEYRWLQHLGISPDDRDDLKQLSGNNPYPFYDPNITIQGYPQYQNYGPSYNV